LNENYRETYQLFGDSTISILLPLNIKDSSFYPPILPDSSYCDWVPLRRYQNASSAFHTFFANFEHILPHYSVNSDPYIYHMSSFDNFDSYLNLFLRRMRLQKDSFQWPLLVRLQGIQD
jgi:hypothetical protein